MEQESHWQLFNTSWTLHRLSPLHHGKDFETLLDNPAALKAYATRLRDQLTGDILAGLHASATTAEDDALSKTGALKKCLWQSISAGAQGRRAGPSFPGILVTLEYENNTYKAALLADAEPENQREGSTFFPLLLTKLPNALRQTFISFLSTNFDTYCSNLRLPSTFLCKGLEDFVDELRNGRGPSGRSAANETIEEGIKELQLTLAFSPSIAPALRTLNITISRASLIAFLRDEAPKSKRTLKQKLRSPLIGNLTAYLETHLAMQLDLDGSSQNQTSRKHVRLSKIACAAFVLGGEGRMKLVVGAEPAADDQPDDAREQSSPALHASEMLLEMVVRRAIIGDEKTT
ncbi:uncharacterized protein N7443_010529 [Penicillium atrosanguineum]|uniref:uncharacterized protein n=1 Tax=Penicillium atrosanguineum TaxID=1132637 RepID=UPI0023887B58|nr:uncharacterized protein N7443_010529 [Penicillium atrosanguineum]KAJ5141506.1 hypothetical protein N7526_002501 [Penicillium atrosanguineum]KAJ5290276.1 hypothetical protein N7443_010529 [Penicillium atrosanguineum]